MLLYVKHPPDPTLQPPHTHTGNSPAAVLLDPLLKINILKNQWELYL